MEICAQQKKNNNKRKDYTTMITIMKETACLHTRTDTVYVFFLKKKMFVSYILNGMTGESVLKRHFTCTCCIIKDIFYIYKINIT